MCILRDGQSQVWLGFRNEAGSTRKNASPSSPGSYICTGVLGQMPGNNQKKTRESKYLCMADVFHWGETASTTVLRKILLLDLSSGGKRSYTYSHEEERGGDASDAEIYRHL